MFILRSIRPCTTAGLGTGEGRERSSTTVGRASCAGCSGCRRLLTPLRLTRSGGASSSWHVRRVVEAWRRAYEAAVRKRGACACACARKKSQLQAATRGAPRGSREGLRGGDHGSRGAALLHGRSGDARRAGSEQSPLLWPMGRLKLDGPMGARRADRLHTRCEPIH